MPFLQLFYHLVWATKGRKPLITADLEPALYGFIRSKAVGLGGVVYQIGGVEDHVHVVASVPAQIALSTFVGQVKGVSSAHTNKDRELNTPRFAWQEDYGAFTFDAKRLPYLIAYVERQKEHHAEKRTIPLLERMTGDTDGYLVRETDVGYVVDYDAWIDAMIALG